MQKVTEFQKLKDFLSSHGPGRVAPSRLNGLLAACWELFDIEDDGGLTAEKLYGRMENIEWEPPNLTFRIERHGGRALGSSRATLQQWSVNLDEKRAGWSAVGFRQEKPRALPFRVEPIAEELAELIEGRVLDRRLKWQTPDRVKVLVGEVLPDDCGPRQTLEGRRRRLRDALTAKLRATGWDAESAPWVFRKTTEPLS